MDTIRAELAQGIIQLEAVRAFIHPVQPVPPVMPVVYRSSDDVNEADEIHRMRREAKREQ